jgi:hypothetical protein
MIRMSNTLPQHIAMESIHAPHSSPSTFIQTRLQGHTHAYLILFTASTTPVYNFQKASIILNYFLNPHTTGPSSLYSQLIKKSASPSLLTLVPNPHSIPQMHTLYYFTYSPICFAPMTHTSIRSLHHNRCPQQPLIHYPLYICLLTYQPQPCTNISTPPIHLHYTQLPYLLLSCLPTSFHYQLIHQPAPSLLPTLASHHHFTLQLHTHYSHPAPNLSDLTAHTLSCPSFPINYFQQPILQYHVFIILLTPTYHNQPCNSIAAPPTSCYLHQTSQLLPDHSLPPPSHTTHSSSIHLHYHFYASPFPAASNTVASTSSTSHSSFNPDIFSAHQIFSYPIYQTYLKLFRQPNAPTPPAQQHFKTEVTTESPTQVNSLYNPRIKTNPNHLLLTPSLRYALPSYNIPNLFSASLALLTYSTISNTLHDYAGSELSHDLMARTKVSASLTGQSTDTNRSSDKSAKSQASGSRKKRLTVKMDLLALQHSSQPASPGEHMGNDQNGPIAVRDYPAGSPMLLPLAERAQLLAGQVRPKRHRRLLDAETDADSDGSQGDRPSNASVSRSSAYQDVSMHPNPLSPQLPTESTSNLHSSLPASQPPVTQQVDISQLPSTAAPSLSAMDDGPSTVAPMTTSHCAPTPHSSPADFAHHLWLTYSVHEQHNAQLGLPTFTTYGDAALVNTDMPESELREYNSCRHSFPHVPQRLFPMTRPDGLPGQYFHLTQLPYGTDIDPTTGLARSYQIVIRFDSGYNDMTKNDVQDAARARFDAMGIALAQRFREPISALIHRQTKNWLGSKPPFLFLARESQSKSLPRSLQPIHRDQTLLPPPF